MPCQLYMLFTTLFLLVEQIYFEEMGEDDRSTPCHLVLAFRWSDWLAGGYPEALGSSQ